MPSRSLNWAIDFLALVITGFWPAICCISAAAVSTLLLVLGRLADAHVDDDLVEPAAPRACSCSRTSRSSPGRCARHSRPSGAACSPSAPSAALAFDLLGLAAASAFSAFGNASIALGLRPSRPSPDALDLLDLLGRGLLRLVRPSFLRQPWISSPVLAATRTFLPSRTSKRTRVGLPSCGRDRDLRNVQRRFLALDPALRVGLRSACGGARGR